MGTCRSRVVSASILLVVSGCSGDDGSARASSAPPEGTRSLTAEPQRSGDAESGYRALVNEGYVSCGVPIEAYEVAFGSEAPASDRLEGRSGVNARLGYGWTAIERPEQVTVVTTNCLSCHASKLNGELVVGLGSTTSNFTGDQASQLPLVRGLLERPESLAEFDKFAGRLTALAPFVRTETIGANSADNIAPVLYAHRDRETLEWHDEPLMPLPDTPVVPLDVPPWWRMKKKHSMFYTGMGRGDHARIMMSASSLCVDDVEQANAIDAYFPDIYAFLRSIEPPRYPYAVDESLAREGRLVFEETCSRCHGTYGDDESYPNLVVDLDVIGTDAVLATSSKHLVGPYIDWFNESFWGEKSRLEPNEGYVAPPLDGVWATAPYLHNGSVPTIAELLNSKTRPAYWTRDRKDSTSYDEAALGFTYEALDHGQEGLPEAEQAPIYDTTLEGYGNGGHTFGDALSGERRTALLEYLKTL